MKKITALLLIILVSFTLFFTGISNTVSAQDEQIQVITGIEQYLIDFLQDNPDRTSFSENEQKAGKWIEQKFEDFGLETQVQNFEVDYNKKTQTSQNIIGVINNQKEKQVIICAHYDNIYGSEEINGFEAEGAYNNGTGVAVMLALADYFAKIQVDLDFNIIFLALGAEEPGLNGSSYYVSKMLSSEKGNTLLVIDLDCVGGGDYLYLYCDELETIHQQFIKKIADDNNRALKLPPKNKKTFSIPTSLTPYMHYGLNSANLNFLKNGINSAHFFSRNWDTTKKIGMVESEKHPSIIYTKNDTLEILRKYYGDTFLQKMNNAADIIYYTLTNDNFVKSMQDSLANKKDYSLMLDTRFIAYLKLCLIIIMGVIVMLLIRQFNNRYPMPVIKIRQAPPTSVFGDEYENSKGPYNQNGENKNPFDGY